MSALCVMLAVACGFDYRCKKIPNQLIVLMTAVGTGWRYWESGIYGVLSYFGEAVLIIALLYPFFKIGTIGGGDVKILGASAGYFLFSKVLTFLFISLLFAAVYSLFKMCKERSLRERMHYLLQYLQDVVKSGNWKLYMEDKAERRRTGICLSGPVLLSVLLHIGGVY